MRPKMLFGLLIIVSLVSLIPFAAGDQNPQVWINGCPPGSYCPTPLTISGRQVTFSMSLTLSGNPDTLQGSPQILPFQVCSDSIDYEGGCEYVSAYVTPVPGNPMDNPNGGDNPWILGYDMSLYIPYYISGTVTLNIPAQCCTDSHGTIFPTTTIELATGSVPLDPNALNMRTTS